MNAMVTKDKVSEGQGMNYPGALSIRNNRTAFAAMERLVMKADNTVDTFLAKWNKFNVKLGCDKNSRPAVTKFRNKLPASLTSNLLDLRPT